MREHPETLGAIRRDGLGFWDRTVRERVEQAREGLSRAEVHLLAFEAARATYAVAERSQEQEAAMQAGIERLTRAGKREVRRVWKDPEEAWRRVLAEAKSKGARGVAAQVASRPEQYGALRGEEQSAGPNAERFAAQQTARAVAERLRQYEKSVDALRAHHHARQRAEAAFAGVEGKWVDLDEKRAAAGALAWRNEAERERSRLVGERGATCKALRDVPLRDEIMERYEQAAAILNKHNINLTEARVMMKNAEDTHEADVRPDRVEAAQRKIERYAHYERLEAHQQQLMRKDFEGTRPEVARVTREKQALGDGTVLRAEARRAYQALRPAEREAVGEGLSAHGNRLVEHTVAAERAARARASAGAPKKTAGGKEASLAGRQGASAEAAAERAVQAVGPGRIPITRHHWKIDFAGKAARDIVAPPDLEDPRETGREAVELGMAAARAVSEHRENKARRENAAAINERRPRAPKQVGTGEAEAGRDGLTPKPGGTPAEEQPRRGLKPECDAYGFTPQERQGHAQAFMNDIRRYQHTEELKAHIDALQPQLAGTPADPQKEAIGKQLDDVITRYQRYAPAKAQARDFAGKARALEERHGKGAFRHVMKHAAGGATQRGAGAAMSAEAMREVAGRMLKVGVPIARAAKAARKTAEAVRGQEKGPELAV